MTAFVDSPFARVTEQFIRINNVLTARPTSPSDGDTWYYNDGSDVYYETYWQGSVYSEIMGKLDWTPALASPIGWYDASDASTVTESGGNVSQWRDKSGNGYDMNQTDGSRQPNWGLGAQIDGKNVMHYSNTFDEMFATTADIPCNQLAIISIAQARPEGDFPSMGAVLKGDSSDIMQSRAFCTPTSGKINSTIRLNNSNWSAQSGNIEEIAEENSFVFSVWYDGADFVATTNGGTFTSSADVTDGATFTINRIQCGRESGTPRNYHGEMVVIPTSNTATIQLVEGYLAWKWGVAWRLADGHPYKLDGTIFGFGKVWTPAEASPAAWFDATDASTISTSGSSVTQWDDKSGNGNNVSRAGANQPRTGVRDINGRNALDFDASDDVRLDGLDAPSLNLDSSGGSNIFAVFDSDAFEVQGSFANAVVSKGSVLSSSAGYGLYFQATGRLYYNSGLNVGPSTPYDVTGPPLLTSAVMDVAGSIARLYVNGDLKGSDSSGTYTTDNSNGLRVGGDPTASSRYWDGAIGEIIITGGVLTDQERQLYEGYLAWKWGTNWSLPVSHPYRSDGRQFDSPNLWTPAEITTLDLWFDASDVTQFVESGGAVSQWNDISGNNNNGTQSDGSKQPTIRSRTINGLNTAYSDGNDRMQLDTAIDTTQHEFYGVVWVAEYDNSGNQYVLSVTQSNIRYGREANQARHRFLDAGLAYMDMEVIGAGDYPKQMMECLYGDDVTGEYHARSNGVETDNITGRGVNSIQIDQIPGQYANSGSTAAWGEIIIWHGSAEDLNEIQKLEGYLAWKWGQEGILDSAHPYKNAPPYL